MASFRVLIVDDQHEVRRMLAASLRTLGSEFDVLEVPSAEEALLISSRLPLDLMVTDVRLPGMSGLELVEVLKKRASRIRTILLTGVEEPRLRLQVAEAGADAFFYKPVEMADFLDAVERCLGLAGKAFPLPPVAEEPIVSKDHRTISQTSLVEKTPLASVAVSEPARKTDTLVERLTALRRQLNAISVSLLNEGGRTAAVAGKLPDFTPGSSLIPVLMSAFNAGQKVAQSLGQGKSPDNLLCFSGKRFHLCLAPVGALYALLIVSLDSFTPGRLSEVGQAIRPAANDLLGILQRMGVELEPRQATPSPPLDLPVDVAVDAVTLASVEALFGQSVKDSAGTGDADVFWDTLADNPEQDGSSNEGGLSYEQARKLGLAPGGNS